MTELTLSDKISAESSTDFTISKIDPPADLVVVFFAIFL
jgi:hypothetical protein